MGFELIQPVYHRRRGRKAGRGSRATLPDINR